jgi:hypothetical protein
MLQTETLDRPANTETTQEVLRYWVGIRNWQFKYLMLVASPACLINHWYGRSRAAALHEFHFSIVWPITVTALRNVTPCSFVDGTNVSKESVVSIFRVEEVNTVLP